MSERLIGLPVVFCVQGLFDRTWNARLEAARPGDAGRGFADKVGPQAAPVEQFTITPRTPIAQARR